jgi:hypothetical protein
MATEHTNLEKSQHHITSGRSSVSENIDTPIGHSPTHWYYGRASREIGTRVSFYSNLRRIWDTAQDRLHGLLNRAKRR